ncbi:hypothetical protein D3C83_86030 [compost metagenome]
MALPAAGDGGFQEKAGAAADIQQAAAVGRQELFETRQPVILRQLEPGLVFAGMGDEVGLFLGIVIFAVFALQAGRIGQWQHMAETAGEAVDDVVIPRGR